MPVIPNSAIQYLVDKYRINTKVLTPAKIREGIKTELEHRDIIGNNLEAAFRIALAHWNETNSMYYKELKKMERHLNKTIKKEQLFV